MISNESLITICEIGLFLIISFCIYKAISQAIKEKKNGVCWIHDYKPTGKTSKVYFKNKYGTKDYELGEENICSKCGNRVTFFN